jgi:hypothetical protein
MDGFDLDMNVAIGSAVTELTAVDTIVGSTPNSMGHFRHLFKGDRIESDA